MNRVTKTVFRLIFVIMLVFVGGLLLSVFDIPGQPRTVTIIPIKIYPHNGGYVHVLATTYDVFYYGEVRDLYLKGSFTIEENTQLSIYYRTTWRAFHWKIVKTDSPEDTL